MGKCTKYDLAHVQSDPGHDSREGSPTSYSESYSIASAYSTTSTTVVVAECTSHSNLIEPKPSYSAMEVRLTRSSEHWSDFQSKNPFHLTEKDYVDAIEAFELMDVISASASPAAGPGLDITTNDDDDDDASWILYLVCLLELNQLYVFYGVVLEYYSKS